MRPVPLLLWLAGCVPVVVDADHDGVSAADDCDDVDPRVGIGPEWYADADADGFPDLATAIHACAAPDGFLGPEGACPPTPRGPRICPADCDDADPDVHPRAAETCDGRDQDCDGEIDEHALGRAEWHPDADGDGFADPDVTLYGCEQPPDVPTESTDCNDADATAFPGAVEVCDFVDDDCDGVVDDGLPVSDWWRDADRDGFGAPGAPLSACHEPLDYAPNPDDCDDADEDEHPGAVWFPDADGDGYGDEDAPVASCDRPAGHILDGTDCDDTDYRVTPETVWGQDADGDGLGAIAGALAQCEWPGEGWIPDARDCDDAHFGGGYVTSWQDLDGDGYGYNWHFTYACSVAAGWASQSGDCYDGDATVYPGAAELCDLVDNNCDGTRDEATALWWDDDGDGYGDPGILSHSTCAVGHWVAYGTDCDDTNRLVSPGATELCNGHDDDCDALVDGDDPDEAGDATWHEDADGDGYGDDATSTIACAAPPGWVEAAGDCDPTDASVFPGSEEACFDAVDQDCDGRLHGHADTPVLVGEVRSFLGDRALAALGDVDGDGFDDLLVGSPLTSTEGRIRAGTAWIFRGPLVGGTSVGSADAAFLGVDEDRAGWEVAAAGDLDGDGVVDAAIRTTGGLDGAGSVSLLAGDSLGTMDLSSGFAHVVGTAPLDIAGYAIAPWPDPGGDDDLLVSAIGDDTNASEAGAVGHFEGPLSGTVAFADAPQVRGEASSDRLGLDLLTADLDGDGRSDAVLGGDGRVVVLLDRWTGSIDRSDADVAWTGAFRYPALAAGDLDGDGAPDLVVGDDEDGAPYLLDPSSGGRVSDGIPAWAEYPSDDAGAAVAVLDRDQDGIDDLVVGAPGNDGGAAGSGAVYLVLGPILGAVDLADADAIWRSDFATARLGTTVIAAGDVDGDGLPDIIAGAPLDPTGGFTAGALFLFAGSDP